MNQEQNNIPVDVTSNIQHPAEQSLHKENQQVKEYYLHQLRLMWPTMDKNMSDHTRLSALKKRTARLIEMLTLFEHPWTEEVPVLQRACLSYLTMDNIPCKERQQVIEAWAGWSDFQFQLARYRGLLAQFLQYHYRTKQELESMLSTADDETPSEPQENNQEGGI